MNLTATATAFCAASAANTPASLDSAEPPPARSESDRMAMNGAPCCAATSATAADSMSIGVTPSLDRRNCLYAALSTNTLALHPRSTRATAGARARHVAGDVAVPVRLTQRSSGIASSFWASW
ncbi:Os05g0227901 [Oryza sativa Japonica Group]|uniref:Os05g0227901 protein n=1 Tax=Oryza sativa subsp. japonica TaxID=39947 RepID=A0A0P0WJJ3_ORYSJ|nr:hypothetical protein EE612_027980 [Oryza sativa]BAS92904.1 Os05g0227901 [Oryza sativa Japonica Group]